jgi:transposase
MMAGPPTYRAQTSCRHALCNIHHLRELTFLEEHYHQSCAKDLMTLLLEMKPTVEQARAGGLRQLPAAVQAVFAARYLLPARQRACRQPAAPSAAVGRIKQTPALNLLERLWLGQDEVRASLDDPTISFDNNQGQRDLRMLKVQQNVSDPFRSVGAAALFRLCSYLSMLRKQGSGLLVALQMVFAGQPLYSIFA